MSDRTRQPGGAFDRGAGAVRHELGGEQVEGRRAVLELLAAGRRAVREVWMAEDMDPAVQLDEIERWCARRHVLVQSVSRRRLDAAARTDAPQGVLAYADPLLPADLDDLCLPDHDRMPLLLVLDGVTDPHNVGAVLRSAACAGVTGVVLPRHRAAHVTAAVAKVAAGAIEHLDIAVVPGVPAALARLSELGVATVGLDAEAPTMLYELGQELRGPVALVLGSEGRGLGQLTRRRCSVLASIPQPGPLPSLNVATASAIACFEVVRRRLA
ncbi:MAG: 23S rRNA (guanosine(2251)-2'-O)-methyltransferase RlmB [Actinomycetota bacterium]|jgi:23S rRNA (guanosine2251-2'-O)-methyltransferase|nr:23S rRNA (guanosine(2251)-2'-O)-methyltransferase RlmB [Actinomycetota bacterium]